MSQKFVASYKGELSPHPGPTNIASLYLYLVG
ncbi:hypothetical protein TSOC111612_05565 [Tsukamurella ocularis]